MKEGDLITTYYSGYYRLDRIERRFYTEQTHFRLDDKRIGEEYNSLYHFTQEYDKDGKVKKGKQKACDAGFCKLAKDSIINELLKLESRKLKLSDFLETVMCRQHKL
jgi:hypothetical protein